jgi:hypothetical protein
LILLCLLDGMGDTFNYSSTKLQRKRKLIDMHSHRLPPARHQKREIRVGKMFLSVFKLLIRGIFRGPSSGAFHAFSWKSGQNSPTSNDFQIGTKTCHEVPSATIAWTGPEEACPQFKWLQSRVQCNDRFHTAVKQILHSCRGLNANPLSPTWLSCSETWFGLNCDLEGRSRSL